MELKCYLHAEPFFKNLSPHSVFLISKQIEHGEGPSWGLLQIVKTFVGSSSAHL